MRGVSETEASERKMSWEREESERSEAKRELPVVYKRAKNDADEGKLKQANKKMTLFLKKHAKSLRLFSHLITVRVAVVALPAAAVAHGELGPVARWTRSSSQ